MTVSRTIVISCAGMGDRLGFGMTKALVEVEGKPLVIRHLQMLEGEKDIRVVVGYQAEKVIQTVRAYRDDVMFVFNHNYRETCTGDSVVLAAKHANEYILSLDGDLLIHPEDMRKILTCDYEFASGGAIQTDDPWMLQTYEEDGEDFVSSFSKNSGNYEWNGITQIKSEKILKGTGHVFQLLEPHLPLPFLYVRTREIDTINDYKNAVLWVKNGFSET